MLIRIELQWLLTAALASVRLAALLWSTPLFVLGRVPARISVMLVLMFSVCLISIQPAAAPNPAIFTPAGWAFAAVCELAIGLLMAFGLHCAFAAFTFAGRLLDLQIGFSVASLINPSTREDESLLGIVMVAVGVMTFYLVDGHHLIVRSVVQSFQWFPIGQPPSHVMLGPITAQFGLMFSLGTVLVAPVVATLLLVDLALAVAARTMPQMNIFMLSIPIKIVIGLSVLAATTAFMPHAFSRIYRSIFEYWQALA